MNLQKINNEYAVLRDAVQKFEDPTNPKGNGFRYIIREQTNGYIVEYVEVRFKDLTFTEIDPKGAKPVARARIMNQKLDTVFDTQYSYPETIKKKIKETLSTINEIQNLKDSHGVRPAISS